MNKRSFKRRETGFDFSLGGDKDQDAPLRRSFGLAVRVLSLGQRYSRATGEWNGAGGRGGGKAARERTREMKSHCARPALICFALVDAVHASPPCNHLFFPPPSLRLRLSFCRRFLFLDLPLRPRLPACFVQPCDTTRPVRISPATCSPRHLTRMEFPFDRFERDPRKI